MGRYVGWSGTTAVVGMLAAGIPASAQVPPEFHGIWAIARQSAPQCTSKDEGEHLITVHRQGVAGWEWFCTVSKVDVSNRPVGTDGAIEKTATIDLTCGEAGQFWLSRNVWHVRQIDGRKILVTTQLQKTENKSETDNAPFGPLKPNVFVSLNYECK